MRQQERGKKHGYTSNSITLLALRIFEMHFKNDNTSGCNDNDAFHASKRTKNCSNAWTIKTWYNLKEQVVKVDNFFPQKQHQERKPH